MKIANLILQNEINDETEITISIMLSITGGDKQVAKGRWMEDKILEWSEEKICYLEWDFENNKVHVLI